MRQIVPILFVFLIILQPINTVKIYVSFKINQDQIAKTLCVKKEIKNNGCNGKCHLMKELKKAEDKEEKRFPRPQKEKLELLYCQIYTNTNHQSSPDITISRVKPPVRYEVSVSSKHLGEIFKPPKLNCL